ncbi:MAG: Ig domain-containing protein, partial [Candidatus Angelobacter sp.]
QVQNIVLASVPDPVIEAAANLGDPEIANSSDKNATINLRPGESGVVTLRANVASAAALQEIVNNVTPVVVSHAANTGAGTPAATLAITTANGALPAGIAGVGYSTTLASFGGNAPTTWTLLSGSLPPGLVLDPAAGIISGTPATSGLFSFSVSLTDSSKPAPSVAARSLSISIAVPLVIASATLADGIVNAPYSQTLTASGGSSSFIWSLKSGALPAGLTLSPAGVISGTPTMEASASFVVQVKDSGTPQQTATQSLTIRVAAPLVITTAALPRAKFATAYNQALTASGGIAPLNWSVVAGSLPSGLTLSGAGLVNGTPSAVGTFSFTVHLADSSVPQQVRTSAFSLRVAELYGVSFYTQPSSSSPGPQITPSIKVQVVDAQGHGLSGVAVTMSIAVNPVSAVLSGTTTAVTKNNGIAIFASNSLNKSGGYVLQATTNLAGAGVALSNPFNIR